MRRRAVAPSVEPTRGAERRQALNPPDKSDSCHRKATTIRSRQCVSTRLLAIVAVVACVAGCASSGQAGAAATIPIQHRSVARPASPSASPRIIAAAIPSLIPGPPTVMPTAPPTVTPTAPPGTPAATLPRIPSGAIPILYFHRVQAVPHDFATWTKQRQRAFLTYDDLPAAFSAQLDWLASHGYSTILPGDLAAHWDHGTPLPARPVILTFDDGSSSWARTVLPALQARGMVAEFYLTLDAIRSGSITWPQVVQLARAGNGIGAHDVHHVQLAGIRGHAPASSAVMWSEITRVRGIIAAHVGVAPDSMAYVGGGFDATLISLVQRAGYTTARGIVRGIVQTTARRFDLRVVRIGWHDDVRDPVSEALSPGLPTFTARMHGVSDRRRGTGH